MRERSLVFFKSNKFTFLITNESNYRQINLNYYIIIIKSDYKCTMYTLTRFFFHSFSCMIILKIAKLILTLNTYVIDRIGLDLRQF